MEQTTEIQVVLNSLLKEKKELNDKITEIDKVIKRIRYGNLNLGLSKVNAPNDNDLDKPESQQRQDFPLKADLKIQAIKIFDIIGVACKLSDIRDKHHEITGLRINFRETLRNLNRHDILKLVQPKGNVRGLYWIKAEWIDEDGKLKEQHKFQGFELMYSDEMIEFK